MTTALTSGQFFSPLEKGDLTRIICERSERNCNRSELFFSLLVILFFSVLAILQNYYSSPVLVVAV